MIRGLNHITLATADLATSIAFYQDVLGLKVEKTWSEGAYLSAGELWLCLSLDPTTQPSTDYTHVAFDVAADSFDVIARTISESGARVWKQNRSEGVSLYFCDPDGHRLELHVGNLASRLQVMNKELETC